MKTIIHMLRSGGSTQAIMSSQGDFGFSLVPRFHAIALNPICRLDQINQIHIKVYTYPPEDLAKCIVSKSMRVHSFLHRRGETRESFSESSTSRGFSGESPPIPQVLRVK